MFKNKFISILLISVLLLPGCYEPAVEKNKDVFFGIDIDSKDVPMFTLITENNTEFNLTEYKGKVVVISFVFTRCPDVCPVVVQSLKWLSQQFPDEYHSDLEILAITNTYPPTPFSTFFCDINNTYGSNFFIISNIVNNNI